MLKIFKSFHELGYENSFFSRSLHFQSTHISYIIYKLYIYSTTMTRQNPTIDKCGQKDSTSFEKNADLINDLVC